jgi:cytochrome c-type biogenesis protein CcmH/NrfG
MGTGYTNRHQKIFTLFFLGNERAIELNPNSANAYTTYAESLKNRMGPTSEVAALFRKAYELDPKDGRAQHRLALSFETLGQWEEAILEN